MTAIFRQLERMSYSGYVNLEYEIDADDPLPGHEAVVRLHARRTRRHGDLTEPAAMHGFPLGRAATRLDRRRRLCCWGCRDRGVACGLPSLGPPAS